MLRFQCHRCFVVFLFSDDCWGRTRCQVDMYIEKKKNTLGCPVIAGTLAPILTFTVPCHGEASQDLQVGNRSTKKAWITWCTYPLVNCYITMENHRFSWDNSLDFYGGSFQFVMWLFTRDSLSLKNEFLAVTTTTVVWKTNATRFGSIPHRIHGAGIYANRGILMVNVTNIAYMDPMGTHLWCIPQMLNNTFNDIELLTILAACSPAQENVKARNGPVNDKHTRKRRKALQQSITTTTQWMQTILYGKIIDNDYTMTTGKKNKKEDEEELNRKRTW